MANRGDIKSIWGYGGGVYSRKDDFHQTFFAEIGMSFYDQWQKLDMLIFKSNAMYLPSF